MLRRLCVLTIVCAIVQQSQRALGLFSKSRVVGTGSGCEQKDDQLARKKCKESNEAISHGSSPSHAAKQIEKARRVEKHDIKGGVECLCGHRVSTDGIVGKVINKYKKTLRRAD